MVKVYADDTIEETARKIFEQFELFQSCTIEGYVMINKLGVITNIKEECDDSEERGKLVWERLRKLDQHKYAKLYGKKLLRLRKKIPNSIGGFVAQPIFCHNRRKSDGVVKWAIWRHQ